MTAQELRIGNWVLFYGEFTQVYSIGTYGCSFNNGFAKYTLPNLKPIPLTEEILLKCGFEFKPEGEEVYEQIWKLNSFEIWEHSEGFCYDYLYGKDIDYLHQLQNLYFALTGQELETIF